MTRLRELFRSYLNRAQRIRCALMAEENGQDLIEYSLLIGGITLVAAAAILSVGSDSNTLWGVFNNEISGS